MPNNGTIAQAFQIDIYITAAATPDMAQGQKLVFSQLHSVPAGSSGAFTFPLPQELRGFQFTATATA